MNHVHEILKNPRVKLWLTNRSSLSRIWPEINKNGHIILSRGNQEQKITWLGQQMCKAAKSWKHDKHRYLAPNNYLIEKRILNNSYISLHYSWCYQTILYTLEHEINSVCFAFVCAKTFGVSQNSPSFWSCNVKYVSLYGSET
jgi:hypothetical protein